MKMSSGDFISNKRISTKYELTPVLEDDEYMEDYFRKTLSDYTPEPASREDEYKSKRSSETSGVMDRRYGRDSDSSLYKPDLFLADMSKDPRSLMDSADLNGFRKFMEHRKDALKINLLNDDDKSIYSKTMTHNESRKKKDEVFYRVKKNYTNFEEQVINTKPSKMLSQKKIEKNKKSLTEYIINSDKKNYANFQDSNKHSSFQNKNNGDRKSLQNSDYSINKKAKDFSKIKDRKNNGMNLNKINSNIRKGQSDIIDSIDKQILNYGSKQSMKIASKKAISISKSIENNKMFKSNEQIAGKKMASSIQLNSSNFNNTGKQSGVNGFRLDNDFLKESKSNKETFGVERLIESRINRNKQIAPVINDSRLNAESISNKDKENYSKLNNTTMSATIASKNSSNLISSIKQSLRISNFSGDKNKIKESKENKNKRISTTHIPFSKKSIINNYETFKDTRKSQLGNNKEQISIYNYKTKKPVFFEKAALVNSGEIEIQRNHHKSKDNVEQGMRRSANKYKQIGMQNSKEAGDMSFNTGITADRITVKPAGSTGVIGNKFIRHKIETDEDESSKMGEMTSFRKTY